MAWSKPQKPLCLGLLLLTNQLAGFPASISFQFWSYQWSTAEMFAAVKSTHTERCQPRPRGWLGVFVTITRVEDGRLPQYIHARTAKRKERLIFFFLIPSTSSLNSVRSPLCEKFASLIHFFPSTHIETKQGVRITVRSNFYILLENINVVLTLALDLGTPTVGLHVL